MLAIRVADLQARPQKADESLHRPEGWRAYIDTGDSEFRSGRTY
jgi:hypothetical protein